MASSAVVVTLYAFSSTTVFPVELGSLTDPRVHGLTGLAGDEKRAVQVEELMRAKTVSVFERGNRTENITLNVTKLHPTLREAFIWWLTHPASVPIKVNAKFEQAGVQRFLRACAVQGIRRTERPGGGLTTIMTYELVGGVWANSLTSSPSVSTYPVFAP